MHGHFQHTPIARNCQSFGCVLSLILDPQGSKTPEPIDIKLDQGDYVGDLTPHANFGISTLCKSPDVPLQDELLMRTNQLRTG